MTSTQRFSIHKSIQVYDIYHLVNLPYTRPCILQATIYLYKRYLGFGLTLYIDIINIIPTEKTNTYEH